MSFLKRVTFLNAGKIHRLFKEKRKRKSSRHLRPLEKIRRRWLEAANVRTTTELRRHKRSARKEKDGWLHDLHFNHHRAHFKGFKKLHRL